MTPQERRPTTNQSTHSGPRCVRGLVATRSSFITEDDPTEYDDDTPMTLTELQDSICSVLGADLPLGEPTRLSQPKRRLAVDRGRVDSGAGDWAFGLADHSAEAGFG